MLWGRYRTPIVRDHVQRTAIFDSDVQGQLAHLSLAVAVEYRHFGKRGDSKRRWAVTALREFVARKSRPGSCSGLPSPPRAQQMVTIRRHVGMHDSM
jgi:hypothetical protein